MKKFLLSLRKIAVKYQSQLTDQETVFRQLQIEMPDTESINNSAAKIKELLAALAEVKEWEPPVKKGKFSFDEKKFFKSVSDQFADGKTLSVKQIAALEKLAAKYLTPGNKKGE